MEPVGDGGSPLKQSGAAATGTSSTGRSFSVRSGGRELTRLVCTNDARLRAGAGAFDGERRADILGIDVIVNKGFRGDKGPTSACHV